MNRIATSLLSVALLLGLLSHADTASAAHHGKAPEGFKPLFNGKDLTGWWGEKTTDPRSYMSLPADKLKARMAASMDDINAHWSVENGELVNDGKGLYLTTKKFYGDFELMLEYKTVAKADSGIYLRGIPQVQIWDTTKEGGKWKIGADKGSGGLWNNPANWPGKDPTKLMDKPFGQWNAMKVRMIGERVTVWMNGEKIVDHARMSNFYDRKAKEDVRKPIPATGPIQLQTHGGEIRWRNVFIRELTPEQSNELLASHRGEGFAELFNGKDLSGWKGAAANYQVLDGAIQCKKGKGGVLFSEKQYADFHASLQFKLPPGGNNGLAIRYPGQGDAAYGGMCELQVLDNTAPKYAKLNVMQYHGSVYAQWPAHRGYLRKPGEWNYQEVIVKGSHIIVELNGTRILDKDISTIKKFMYKPEKFKGRDRKQGHFGFAGHSDPVSFRAIAIKELK